MPPGIAAASQSGGWIEYCSSYNLSKPSWQGTLAERLLGEDALVSALVVHQPLDEFVNFRHKRWHAVVAYSFFGRSVFSWLSRPPLDQFKEFCLQCVHHFSIMEIYLRKLFQPVRFTLGLEFRQRHIRWARL